MQHPVRWQQLGTSTEEVPLADSLACTAAGYIKGWAFELTRICWRRWSHSALLVARDAFSSPTSCLSLITA